MSELRSGTVADLDGAQTAPQRPEWLTEQSRMTCPQHGGLIGWLGTDEVGVDRFRIRLRCGGLSAEGCAGDEEFDESGDGSDGDGSNVGVGVEPKLEVPPHDMALVFVLEEYGVAAHVEKLEFDAAESFGEGATS